MEIVEYTSERSNEIANLFTKAVHEIDDAIYNKAQKNAWAPQPIDYNKWEKRLARTKPFILLINNQVAGFMELEVDGHIDCAYVHPNYQRQGVASSLLKHVIELAEKTDLKELTVEASIVAKPFFEAFGFVMKNQNKVIRNGVVLINYSMLMKNSYESW